MKKKNVSTKPTEIAESYTFLNDKSFEYFKRMKYSEWQIFINYLALVSNSSKTCNKALYIWICLSACSNNFIKLITRSMKMWDSTTIYLFNGCHFCVVVAKFLQNFLKKRVEIWCNCCCCYESFSWRPAEEEEVKEHHPFKLWQLKMT